MYLNRKTESPDKLSHIPQTSCSKTGFWIIFFLNWNPQEIGIRKSYNQKFYFPDDCVSSLYSPLHKTLEHNMLKAMSFSNL